MSSSIFSNLNISIVNSCLINDLHLADECELTTMMSKYGSDKGWGLTRIYLTKDIRAPNKTCHNYTFFYNSLFQNYRNEPISIFEMGVGVPSCMRSFAGSLKGWQDYFKNSEIFAADIDKDYLYNEDRIKSFYVDQENAVSIQNLWSQLSNKTFDLMLDDGPHTFSSNYLFFTLSIHKLKNGGIYIIEDVNLDFIDKLYNDINSFCLNNNIIINIEKLIIPYPKQFTHSCPKIIKMNNLIIIHKLSKE